MVNFYGFYEDLMLFYEILMVRKNFTFLINPPIKGKKGQFLWFL